MTPNELELYEQMIENEELVMIKYFIKAKEQSRKGSSTELLKRCINAAKDSVKLHAKNIDWLEYDLQQLGINRIEAIRKRNHLIEQIQIELEQLLTHYNCI